LPKPCRVFNVRSGAYCSSSRKVSGLTPTEVFCPSHSQKPHCAVPTPSPCFRSAFLSIAAAHCASCLRLLQINKQQRTSKEFLGPKGTSKISPTMSKPCQIFDRHKHGLPKMTSEKVRNCRPFVEEVAREFPLRDTPPMGSFLSTKSHAVALRFFRTQCVRQCPKRGE
jgi:hypothetical protein